ncbi:MAG: hypothetical protein IPO78_04115 [Saprospiraceae bacterium]|nr:hypothetical protein [Saprospiraceae bacterium]MBK9223258.1 hypothetical protein [Saprospiraceae bacterium]MBK9720788.1 hypothetical protein [Saprospiraceae bacterium]
MILPTLNYKLLTNLVKHCFITFLFLLSSRSSSLYCQLNGSFKFDTVSIPNWPAIHSFSFAYADPYILMIGGRKDGIHPKESGFEIQNSNQTIYLWNTISDSIIRYELDSLSLELIDYLSSANTSFTQDSQFLYIIGGYSQSIFGNFKTYPILIQITLNDCIQKILQNKDISPSIKVIHNDTFAVAGGQLRKLDTIFYLVGGHRFDGKYSSSSSKTNQRYTDALRIFTITPKNDTLSFNIISEIHDDFNFHRRDFNLNPIIAKNGEVKLMAYSGVFQYNLNIPFLNTALIHGSQFEEILDFDHKFAAYTCARAGIFDRDKNEMHQIFFGGMAEYYRDSINQISRDAFVPFVKSISAVTRKADGRFEEYLFKEQLPGFFGANAEFIINPKLKTIYQDILDYSSFENDTTFIGTIFGGIYNPTEQRNPWQFDMAQKTVSNPYLLKVYFIKNNSTNTNSYKNTKHKYNIELQPNPAKDKFIIKFEQEKEINSITYWLQDAQGKIILNKSYQHFGNTQITISTAALSPQNYSVYLLINGETILKKQVLVIK